MRTQFNTEINMEFPLGEVKGAPECFGKLWDPQNSTCSTCPGNEACCTKCNTFDEGWYLGDMRFDLLPADLDLREMDETEAIEWLIQTANADKHWATMYLKYHIKLKNNN